MGRSITETTIRSNLMTSRPQKLHDTEPDQPYAAPSSGPGTLQLETYDKRRPVQASMRDLMGCPTPVSPQNASQALTLEEVLRGSKNFDANISFAQVDAISKAINRDVPGISADTGTRMVLSKSIEPISPASLVASASKERSPPGPDVQTEYDSPRYSIGQVKVFDKVQKAIEPPYEARWDIIHTHIFDRVLSKLRQRRLGLKSIKPRDPPTIELMSAGATRDTSIPAVVVVIPKNIKMMQNFLDTDGVVQNLCRPRDGATVEFQTLACRGHSMLVGSPGEPLSPDATFSSENDLDCLSDDEDSIVSTYDSAYDSDNSEIIHPLNTDFLSVVFENSETDGTFNHGLGIRLVTKDGSRYARGTCGGLLQLQTPSHPPRQIGLLAGHLLEELKQSSIEAIQETYETRSLIGDILYPKSTGEVPRHDWALFNADKLSFKTDMAKQQTLSIAQVSELPNENTTVSIRTSKGEVMGTLSSSTSGIMLNPDQGFVHVRMVIMHKGSTITKGDSGAWVVHEGLGKVYGHIIATNGNGDAYMVPLHATITEMKASLGAINITLATPPDTTSLERPPVAHEHLQQTEESIPLLETQKQANPSVNIDEAKQLNDLAATCLEKGQAEKAIKLLERAVSIQEQLPPEDESRLASKHDLGRAYCKIGCLQEAIQVLEDVTKIRGQIPEENHPDRLASQHELGLAYMQSGQPSEAVRILKRVVTIQKAMSDQMHHVDHFNSQHELAKAYLADKEASEAVKVMEHVVTVKSLILSPSDPQLLESQLVLAVAALFNGRASDAVRVLEHVVFVADATCSDQDELRTKAQGWLEFARQQAPGPEPYATTSSSQQWRHCITPPGSMNPSSSTADVNVVETPMSPSSAFTLSRFEFETGTKGNEGTKILMVEWDACVATEAAAAPADRERELAQNGYDDWKVTWEGKGSVTMLPIRDTDAPEGIRRIYFLLPPGVLIPILITITKQSGLTELRTKPLPAIFPEGLVSEDKGTRGVLHTIWAKGRLRELEAEITAEMRDNSESVGLEMVLQERQWIIDHFALAAAVLGRPLTPSSSAEFGIGKSPPPFMDTAKRSELNPRDTERHKELVQPGRVVIKPPLGLELVRVVAPEIARAVQDPRRTGNSDAFRETAPTNLDTTSRCQAWQRHGDGGVNAERLLDAGV